MQEPNKDVQSRMTHLLLLRRCITGLVSWQVLAEEQILCEIQMNCVPSGDIQLQAQGGVHLACPYTRWQMDGCVLDAAGVERARFPGGSPAQLEQATTAAGPREYQILNGGPTLLLEGLETDGVHVLANGIPAAHLRREASGRSLGQAGLHNVDKALALALDRRFESLLPHIVLFLVL